MTIKGWLEILTLVGILLIVSRPLGVYLAQVSENKPVWLSRVFGPLERALYRISGIDPQQEQSWEIYTCWLLIFNFVGILWLYLLQRMQGFLPLNPQHFPAVSSELAFNTAISFVSNTNWQAYSGEVTLSYATQMVGLTVQNFLSASTGLAVAWALIRGIARRESGKVGNFGVDVTRATLYVLLPGCLVGALILVSQGVIQNFAPYQPATLWDAAGIAAQQASGIATTQIIPQGPVASQEAIKMLGTNGGGFFNANSAHPLENPTPLTNFLAVLAMLLIPAALPHTLGYLTGNTKHAWAVLATMTLLFLGGVGIVYQAEAAGNPLLSNDAARAIVLKDPVAGGNMEGKEVRFGIAASALFATATTAASCGAVNAMHDSFTPLAGMVLLLNIMLGEIIFGGVGAGLYGMLIMILLTVFMAGLMVGRTPEYLGKKVEAKEVKMVMFYMLIFAFTVLILSAWSSVASYGLASRHNAGPHGLSEIVYAVTSATGNNGSAFAGLNANTWWYNISLGIAMLIGRFGMIVPVMAVAGSLANKKLVPVSVGTFPVHTPLFVVLLIAVILIVGALTFFPVLALGPIVEQLLLNQGVTF
jgi:potassium-transporting ATPase potassium-binding subunit